MKVLIAEDEPLIALGHEPIGPAADGAAAVELARTSSPDVYLFDIEMPKLDGLQAAAQLTSEGLRRPVVVITGVEDAGLIDRSITFSASMTRTGSSSAKRSASPRASAIPPGPS